MRKKIKTLIKPLGFVRNYQHEKYPTKTYIYAGNQEGRNVVILNQYILSDVAFFGWITVKKYKGKLLQFDQVLIRLETLIEITGVLADNMNVYQKIQDYVDSNDSDTRG